MEKKPWIPPLAASAKGDTLGQHQPPATGHQLDSPHVPMLFGCSCGEGRATRTQPLHGVCKKTPLFCSPPCEAAPAPQSRCTCPVLHVPALLRGVAECHQLLSPALSPTPQPAHSPLLHLLLRDCKGKQEKREKKRQKFSAFAVTAAPLHCPPVNSLGNALGHPTMTSLGDVLGLTRSMSCQVFPTCSPCGSF